MQSQRQFLQQQYTQQQQPQQQLNNFNLHSNINVHQCTGNNVHTVYNNNMRHAQNVYNNMNTNNVYNTNNVGNIFGRINVQSVQNVNYINNNNTFYIINNNNNNINSMINQSNINYIGNEQTLQNYVQMPGIITMPNLNHLNHTNTSNLQSRKRKLDLSTLEEILSPSKKRRLCQVNFNDEEQRESLSDDTGKEEENNHDSSDEEVAQLIVDSSSQRPSSYPILLNQLIDFVNSNSYVLETPSSLDGVPINQSPLRRNGMNIISVDYSTQVPNPKQLLRKNGQLVVFGPKKDTQEYLNNIGESQDLMSASSNSIRFPQFCQQLAQNYLACVPAPDWLVGSTLAQTPQLSQSGITALAVNLQVQHPSALSNTPLKANDMLLCCFNSANDKDQQLLHAFEQIKNKKDQPKNG